MEFRPDGLNKDLMTRQAWQHKCRNCGDFGYTEICYKCGAIRETGEIAFKVTGEYDQEGNLILIPLNYQDKKCEDESNQKTKNNSTLSIMSESIDFLKKHRKWFSSKSGVVTSLDERDIINTYAIIQESNKGNLFCPNCYNPFCPYCKSNMECCECGQPLP